MKNIDLISSILSRPWMINPMWAEKNLPIVTALLNDQSVDFPSKPSASIPNNLPESLQEDFQNRPRVIDVSAGTIRASFYKSFSEAPKGSLAYIPVVGPIAKYYNCGVPGSSDMARWVKEAEESDKIDGLVFVFDTPGGMVDGTATLGDAIRNCSKPTVGFVDDGQSASAGMWLLSQCDEIILSQKTDMVGSIGVFTTLMDFKGRAKKLGITIHQIYAPQSTDKNKTYRDALEGDDSGIKAELKFLADSFIETVKLGRGEKLDLSKGDPFTGKMYFAEEAISIGLADRIGTIEDAIVSVYERVGQTKSTSNHTSNSSSNMFGNKTPKLTALSGKKAEEVSEEDINAVNAELKGLGIEAVSVVPTSFQADAEKLIQDNASVQKLSTDLKKAQDDLASAQKSFTDEQAAHQVTKTELSGLKDKTTAEETPKPKVDVDPKLESEDKITSEADEEVIALRKSMGISN